ncbi:MAG TPA: DUF2147 domain-containing protein [Sphingobium sp.]
MQSRRRWSMLGSCLGLISAVPALAADQSFGVWRNPSNSVHVRAKPCGKRMCGVVVWANDKAKADARRGGTAELVGADLFRDFTQEKPGVWRGKVFVPDIAKTFSGTVTVIDPNTLRGEGCLLGRIACKSQTWTRLPE